MPTEVLDPVSIVPLECRRALKRLRYHDITHHDQVAWLEGHFFRPADVPETAGMAGIESVRRVRQVTWAAIEHLEAARIRAMQVRLRQPSSKPALWRARDHALQRIVHQPDEGIPHLWQWPLVMQSVEGDWFPGEALWCLTRKGVMSQMLSRLGSLSLFRMAASVVAADLGEFPRRAEIVFQTTTAVSPHQAELVGILEQTMQASPVAYMKLSVAAKTLFEPDAVLALRRLMGLVASICQESIPDTLELQRRILAALKYQIAFGDPTEAK